MAARPISTAGAPEQAVHLVPAQVQHNGPAAVQAYFRQLETGASADGLPLLQASLRGRSLTGVRLPLPEGYTGVVLERQQGSDGAVQHAGGHGGDAAPAWRASACFPHLHYYHHDAAPLKGDNLRRCLEWCDVAGQVHAPVDPAAVAAAAAEKLQVPAS